MDTSNVLRRLGACAARQHGAIAVAQLADLGVPRGHLDQLVRRGHFVRAGQGVYAVVGTPDTWLHRLGCAYLELGRDAVVSHEAAARLHGLDRSLPDQIELTVPRARRNRSSRAVVHSTRVIGRTDVVRIDGMKVTSATRTIIDLARARISPVRLEAAIDSAVRLGSSSPEVLGARLTELRGRGRWGCRLLDRLLEDSGGHTLLERRFLRLVRHWGLPRPRTQVVHRVGADGRSCGLLVRRLRHRRRVSGQKGHSSPSERARDAQRRTELQDLGRVVYEYTWNDVTRREPVVGRTLRDRLLAAGWRAPHSSWAPSSASRPGSRDQDEG